MDNRKIKEILKSVQGGGLNINEAFMQLQHLPYEDLGIAKVDHHREMRHGIPEVIFAEGKTTGDVKSIAQSMLAKNGKLLITKATKKNFTDVQRLCSGKGKKAHYHERSGIIAAGGAKKKQGLIAVFCAGTSDIPVAEEAAVTADFLGTRTKTIYDVGVAGLHRIRESRDVLHDAAVLIVAAGMEGALPSVIGGMTDKTIIAVPTSVGYGTSLGGLTALFAMLNSCVPGIAVMNIDNGFGAGVLAHRINMLTIKT
jgi:NCAIR mutase (PurE)-related protein